MNRNDFVKRSNLNILEPQTLDPRVSSVEYENETRVEIKITDYVLRIGDSVSHDIKWGLTSVGFGFGFLHVAWSMDLQSILYGSSYVAFTWGISKMLSSNMKLNLVDQFDRNHSVNSTRWQREDMNSGSDPEEPLQKWQAFTLTVGNSQIGMESFNVGELIPAGWEWREFRLTSQNISNSGNFSEKGARLHKDKFNQFRNHFFDYQSRTGKDLISWRDPGHRRGGLEMSDHCRALIWEIARMQTLKKLK